MKEERREGRKEGGRKEGRRMKDNNLSYLPSLWMYWSIYRDNDTIYCRDNDTIY